MSRAPAHRRGAPEWSRPPAVRHGLPVDAHEVPVDQRYRAGGLDLLLQLGGIGLEVGGLAVRYPGGHHGQRHRIGGKARQIEPALADGDRPQPVEIEPVATAQELGQVDELGTAGVVGDDVVVAPC